MGASNYFGSLIREIAKVPVHNELLAPVRHEESTWTKQMPASAAEVVGLPSRSCTIIVARPTARLPRRRGQHSCGAHKASDGSTAALPV
jgi:hypothetical protein